MTERLTLERFEELADAYGGVVARWPEIYRSDAMSMAAEPEAAQILAKALTLDMILDIWSVAAPTANLQAHLINDSTASGRRFGGRARLWWSGIGVAAALAGAAAGAVTVALVAPLEATPDGSTSFGDIAGQET
jgi:hypothetical protein